MSAKRLALCGVFICVAGALSALETLLPPIVPIAGVRVGLGNIVILFMLYSGSSWKAAEVLAVSVLRCVLAAFITGSLMSAVFGIAGGVLALFAMLAVRKITKSEKYLAFAGVAGAVLHIAGQLVTAVVFYGTFSVVYYLPILVSSSIIGGAFTGLCTLLMLRKLPKKFMEQVRNI